MPLDLQQHCDLADRVLELVRARLPTTPGPQIRDWNDRLLVEAFTRAYRCLHSIRLAACRGDADDAAVLTRALVALTLRYLWLARVDDQAERVDRLRRLQLNWVRGRAIYGEELDDLGYVPDDDAEAEKHRQNVAQFRARADELERERVGTLPDDRAIAIRLDRDLQPDQPRFFELLYARIYRPTSDVAHYGIGAALAGFIADPDRPDALTLEYIDEERAAEALGLGLVTFAVLLDFSEPIIRLGVTDEVAQLIQASGLRA